MRRSLPLARSRFWILTAVLAVLAGLAVQRVAFSPLAPLHAAEEPAEDAAPPKDEAEPADETAEERAVRKAAGRIENPFPNRVPAPGLEGGVEWLNTSGEITLKDLRGKIVLLDFWTYCCINCIHVLPDLKYLEQKYDKELVVIGVHSAKFDNEKDSGNIREAILRYEIEHPVINDANMVVWRKFGARSWPTFVLLDPEGFYCGHLSGEGNREILDTVIARVAAYHRSKGTLDETPVRFDLERHRAEPTPLRFPGKVLADAASNRLFISDSNHNRIVVTTLDGKLQEVIGSGAIGSKDGAYEVATFDHPQGMTLVGDRLYVADTENHMIRRVDLAERQVVTLAGTGSQATFRAKGGNLRNSSLNSPWDLLHLDGVLYIAMAGPHQMWSHRIGSETIQAYAGSGREDILDGTLADSALAQPSGIATDGEFLYVCDSEGSSIRKIPTDRKGQVTTVVGAANLPNGRTLFEFGDRDGVGAEVRLQHPLGIAYKDGALYIADSYNHKIKKVQLKTRRATTWLGTGQPGDAIDPPQFSEPAGLSIAGDVLYIADTNNHRICTADLQSGKVSVLEIEGLEPPRPAGPSDDESTGRAPTVMLDPQQVAPGESLAFEVSFQLPEGYKLNELAPLTWRLTTDEEQSLVAAEHLDDRQAVEASGTQTTIEVPLAASEGKATLQLSVTYQFCRDGRGGLCKMDTARWTIPVEVEAGATSRSIALQATAK